LTHEENPNKTGKFMLMFTA